MQPIISQALSSDGIPTHALKDQNTFASYHGTSAKGGFCVIKGDEKYIVHGTLFERCTGSASASGKKQIKLLKIATTPGSENIQGDKLVSIVANCHKTNKSYRIKGKMSKCKPANKAASTNVAKSEELAAQQGKATSPTAPQTSNLSNEPSSVTAPVSPLLSLQPAVIPAVVEHTLKLQKKQTTVQRQHSAFQSELASVIAQRDAGHDPLVSINFASKYLNRSRASLYRDFANSVLTSIKVGHSTRLLLSALDALKTGATIA